MKAMNTPQIDQINPDTYTTWRTNSGNVYLACNRLYPDGSGRTACRQIKDGKLTGPVRLLDLATLEWVGTAKSVWLHRLV